MTVWISPTQAMQAIEKGDGHGVRIAVLDSGIETSHPYFAGRRLNDDVVSDENGNLPQGNGKDIYGHGTAVAGIIWSLAPECRDWELPCARIKSERPNRTSVRCGKKVHRSRLSYFELQLRMWYLGSPPFVQRLGRLRLTCPVFMLSPLPEVRR